MDPIKNPYSPGAGTPPPELAGRSELIARSTVAIERIRARRAARSFIFYGLRGVGKTVLLNKIRQDAEVRDCDCVWVEAPEDRSLPALLLPPLRAALIKLSAGEAKRAALQKAFIALSGFASAIADSGHAEGHLGLKARGSSDHAEAHRNEVTLSFS